MRTITKFAYITDTHWHADQNTCWCQQPACPHLLPRLWDDLAEYLREHPVDFVLHGGDLTHDGTEIQIRNAARVCKKLPAPVKLVLGNHDLNQPESMEHWREFKKVFFDSSSSETCDYAIDLGSATLLAMHNAWLGTNPKPDFYLAPDSLQHAGFTDRQYEWLADQLEREPAKPVILAMHETLRPLPPRLTGLTEPIHTPPGRYVREIQRFVAAHPQIRLVLSGHCHASCRTEVNGTVFLTTAAFVEPPFQIRIVEITPAAIDVTVAYPVDLTRYDIRIDEEKRWSAGRWQDWRVTVSVH